MDAAALLNEQAAVWIRLGDPVRGAALLRESRGIFEHQAATNPEAMVELAETEHVLARLPFHVAAQPGKEQDAWQAALLHAERSEQIYGKLGLQREQARVWETQGRLQLLLDAQDQALHSLMRALRSQQESADVLGLARTTAALSHVLVVAGRPQEAIPLLTDSLTMNIEKGCRVGLAHNRQGLGRITKALTDQPETAPNLADVIDQLERAEALLGRAWLPGAR